MTPRLSLSTHTFREQAPIPGTSGEFSRIIMQIALGGKLIAQDLRKVRIESVSGFYRVN